MKRWSPIVLLALLASLVPSSAAAQNERLDRFAFGVGIGLVDLSGSLRDSSGPVLDDGTETYLTASFRVLLGDRNRARNGKVVVAYLEPEIGYWESSTRIPVAGGSVESNQSDLMVGVNIIGFVPFPKVDYFFGAGLGIHSFDTGRDLSGLQLDDDENFGFNVQTGLSGHLSRNVELYGLLRVDLVEDLQEEQAKVVLGLRFTFG